MLLSFYKILLKKKMEVLVSQLCLTLCNPMNCWPLGSSVHGILQARILAAAAAKSLQSCPTLCDPIDGLLPGSSVSGILQARTLEWVAIFFSNAWKWKVKVKSLSRVRLLATSWTAAHQAPLSMGFSSQEYWSGLLFPSQGIFLTQGLNSSPAFAGEFFTIWATRETPRYLLDLLKEKKQVY